MQIQPWASIMWKPRGLAQLVPHARLAHVHSFDKDGVFENHYFTLLFLEVLAALISSLVSSFFS